MAKGEDSKKVKDLQDTLAEAEERAKRAQTRARDAEEDYRRLQLELVKAKDEIALLHDKTKTLETELEKRGTATPAMAPPPRGTQQIAAVKVPQGGAPVINEKLHGMLERVESLRELLAAASIELSELNADEVALAKKRSHVLTNACTLLARAVGQTGEAPPPLPPGETLSGLGARLSVAPSVDISEVAELVESLRPPRV